MDVRRQEGHGVKLRQVACAPLVLLLALGGACGHDAGGGGDDTDSDGDLDVCDSDLGIDGSWDTTPYDWSDANTPGAEGNHTLPGLDTLDPNIATNGGLAPLAVHAVHLSTGEALLFHGHQDQFLWDVGELSGDGQNGVPMAYRPLVSRRIWPDRIAGDCYVEDEDEFPTYEDIETPAYPDLFCAGHTQLYDGTVFLAGGDVDGGPCGGGLKFAYLFDPTVPIEAAFRLQYDEFDDEGNPTTEPPDLGYAWRQLPDMLVDRWYPTVTSLPDGRILVTSGNSQDPNLDGEYDDAGETTRIVELYNPFEERWERACSSDHGLPGPACDTDSECDQGLTCNSVVPNFPLIGWPSYPFIYVLPDGNIFYGGGEEIDTTWAPGSSATDLSAGQVLLTDTNNGQWQWLGQLFDSQVTGGSSVMFAPGQILKSGGPEISANDNVLASATADAEMIDFSGIVEPDGTPATTFAAQYTVVDEFGGVPPMLHSRHYHNLVTMPSGNVVAMSGNTYGNSSASGVDDFDYDCEFTNEVGELEPIAEQPCENGCPTLCHDPPDGSASHCTVPAASLPTCDDDSQCQTCQGTTQACTDSSECPAGSPCVSGATCSGTTNNCSEDEDCDAGQTCISGQTCRLDHCMGFCNAALDCPDPNQVCREIEQSEHGNTEVPYMCLDACSQDSDCEDNDRCYRIDHDDDGVYNDFCAPGNNECFFVPQTEVYSTSECFGWGDLTASQTVERMYHATSFLLPDGAVLSTGGGGRRGLESNYNAEVLRLHPEPTATLTSPQTPQVPAGNPQTAASVGYGDTLVVFHDDVNEIESLALMRLASTTHGFDQDNRRIPLDWESADASDMSFELRIPASAAETEWNFHMRNIAPPGAYMLFALDATGAPVADALYVNICDPENAGMNGCGVESYTCELTPSFSASTTACSTEPVGGQCPSASQTSLALPLPVTNTATGSSVSGWTVVAHPGMLRGDATSLSARDLETVQGLCQSACERRWGPQSGMACDSPNTFLPPVHSGSSGRRIVPRLHPDARDGSGLFPGVTLPCTLGGDCASYFDEDLGTRLDDSVTDADETTGVGEEYRTAVGTSSYAYVQSGGLNTKIDMAGEAGYSFCTDPSADCPFYFGSLGTTMVETSETVQLACADGTTDTKTVSDLTVDLAQPAWGYEKAGYANMRFSPGALVLDIAGNVDGVPFSVRRMNQEVVTFMAQRNNPDFFQVRVDIQIEGIPCGQGSTATADVHLKLREIAAYLDSPPEPLILTASTVACDGTTRTNLDAQINDPDNDVVETRWYVDNVRIDPAYTALAFTESHTLRVEAEDARGAVGQDERTITCAP